MVRGGKGKLQGTKKFGENKERSLVGVISELGFEGWLTLYQAEDRTFKVLGPEQANTEARESKSGVRMSM